MDRFNMNVSIIMIIIIISIIINIIIIINHCILWRNFVCLNIKWFIKYNRCFWRQLKYTQWTHGVIKTSLLRQNDVVTSFWRNNDVIITPRVHWATIWTLTLVANMQNARPLIITMTS